MKRTLTLTMITDRVGIRTWIWDTGYRIRDTGYGICLWDTGYGIWDMGHGMYCRLQNHHQFFNFSIFF